MFVILCLKWEGLYFNKRFGYKCASKIEITNWFPKDISVVSRYASLDLAEVQGLREIEAETYSYFDGQLHGNRIWTG